MSPITTLTFRSEAEAAVAFYLSVFDRSRITAVTRHPRHGLGPRGDVMMIAFELDGRPFVAMNGGLQFGASATRSRCRSSARRSRRSTATGRRSAAAVNTGPVAG
jgi:predicted 3-demethylubiquinone-9 3-methyltransferase (glyoxalase superfamily)